MARPSRTFSADVGQKSIGISGPDQIEYDFDQLFAMLDPDKVLPDGVTPGGLTAENVRPDGGIATQGYVDSLLSHLLPRGTIVAWYGSVEDIPEGWALCDGRNGTPDLRNRFLVGAGDEYVLGATGGAKEVTLTIDQIPPHSHDYTVPSFTAGHYSGNNYAGGRSTGTTSSVGGGKPHENRPPYYALYFIMKL